MSQTLLKIHSPSDASVRWTRTLVRFYRFRNLQIAERCFAGVDPERIVETPLFGRLLPIRVGRSVTHRLLCLQQERFLPERHLVSRLAAEGDCVIDVGANIGYYLLMLLRATGRRGTVVCIEPEPANLVELRRCIDLNGDAHVEVIEAAVGDSEGRIRLRAGLNGRVADDGVEVSVIRLDSLIDKRPALVKIDIEGFEGQALRGMSAMMREVTPRLFVEMHPTLLNYGVSIREILDEVRPFYPRVGFWEHAEPARPLAKLRSRYDSRRGVRRILDEKSLLASCETGERKQTFWMVCEPAGESRVASFD